MCVEDQKKKSKRVEGKGKKQKSDGKKRTEIKRLIGKCIRSQMAWRLTGLRAKRGMATDYHTGPVSI